MRVTNHIESGHTLDIELTSLFIFKLGRGKNMNVVESQVHVPKDSAECISL